MCGVRSVRMENRVRVSGQTALTDERQSWLTNDHSLVEVAQSV